MVHLGNAQRWPRRRTNAALSADVGFCPAAAMWDCPLMAIRPLSVIGIRTFRTATYRHVVDATSRAQNAGYAIVVADAVHVASPGVADRARLNSLLDTLRGLPQPVWATSLEPTL